MQSFGLDWALCPLVGPEPSVKTTKLELESDKSREFPTNSEMYNNQNENQQ